MSLPVFHQSPREETFVQDPYPAYERLRALGRLVWWEDYGLPVVPGHADVSALLRDRRFGREVPAEKRREASAPLADWQAIEDVSLLELEPPAHTRLRRLVLRGFTSRRIGGLAPEIESLSHGLIDRFEGRQVELLSAFAEKLPVIVIARLIGVPEAMADQLLAWSHAMVAMYQARRDAEIEAAAGRAATEFTAYLTELIAERRTAPRDDLLSELIAARDGAEQLTEQEIIGTAVLLLNAGHEATVHAIGNGVKSILEAGADPRRPDPQALTEEILRHDAPLHMFTRYAKEEAEVLGHRFAAGDEVGLLLGAANRDPQVYPAAELFLPDRLGPPHVSLGAGIHFCVGAPLARLEIASALPILFERCPKLALAAPPHYADRYHFHGLEALKVDLGV